MFEMILPLSMVLPVSLGGGWLGAILSELALWSGVLLLLASGISFYVGWNQRRTAALVDETPRSDVAAVQSPGVVRVRGRVTPAVETDTFESPISAEAGCVLSAWEIEEQYDTPKNRAWEPSAWGIRSVPFSIEDGTGELLVEIDDRTVGNETGDVFTPEKLLATDGVSVEGMRCEFESFDVHVETDYGESPPERITDFLTATEGVSVEPMATDLVVDASKRRYREQTLQAGDEVSVLGVARPRRDAGGWTGHPRDLVVSQSDEVALRLSTRPFGAVADGGGGLLFGLLTGIAGAGLLAVIHLV